MLRILVYIVLLFKLSFVSGQNYITKYYPYINSAEVKIIQADYQSALYLFDSAFNNVNIAFAKDFYNATNCALLVNNKSLAIKYINRLATKGVPKENLFRSSIIKKFILDEQYKYIPQNNINLMLIDTLSNLLKKDQYIHQQKKEGYFDFQGNLENALKLKNLIKEFGFPSEEAIGYNGVLPNENLYTLIIIHQNQMVKQIAFDEILYNAVNNGH